MRGFPSLSLCLICLAACVRTPIHDGTPLNCAISLSGRVVSDELLFGYNYELVNRFAKAEGRHAKIRLAGRRESVLDSLKHGKLDLVVLPFIDSLQTDSLLVWQQADSCGIWVFAATDKPQADFAAQWFNEFRTQEEYACIRQPFMDIYNPMKRVSADFISPYDSLIRVYADTLGWDWKLLAALVYQESRFHIEARSPKGASGLMQLIPQTAEHFGCKDLLNPEENIKAGVLMLKSVEKKYKRIAANRTELAKYTLAAYNAGATRLKDCINYARHLGTDISYWDSVAAVIPDMRHDSVAALDTIKLGRFNGHETVYYVRRVYNYYERYRHICP